MKISTSMEHAIRIAGVSPAESAEMLRRAGFEGVDISMTFDMLDDAKVFSPAWREQILGRAAAAHAEGLEIAQCHLPYYPNHIPLPGAGTYADHEAAMLPRYIRALEIAGEIGCPVAVMHPYSNPDDAADTLTGNLRTIEKLMPLLEKYDVKLALENIWGNAYAWAHASCAEEIIPMIDAFPGGRVGACIDTGHANIFKLDICEMARAYGSRLIALHINGNAGKDEHIIPYSMSGWCELMDFHGFSRALGEIGYQGFYNLELSTGALPPQSAQAYLSFAGSVARALADEA